MKSLTNEEVEQRLLQRVRRKAVFYGQVLNHAGVGTPDSQKALVVRHGF
jgi:hypothetical protein